MPRTTPQPLLALAAALLSVASAQTPSAGVPSDVKHIRCETCESLVSAAHRRFAELRKGSKKALSEEDAMSVVETVCDPEADGGAWLRSLDLQEQGRRLRLVKQAEDGPCGVECATLRLACQALMEEGWENELGEALYGAVDADELAESACREWSSACRKPAPKLDPARPAGPPFRAYTQEERAARLGGPPPAGLLTAAALAGRLGLPPPPASEADPALDGLDGFDDGGGETSGRGSALFSLDRSEAFRPVAGCLPPWCALVVGAVGGAVGGDAAAARGHVSVSGAAPWHDDQAVEAAALLYASHGGAGVLRFWRAWAAAPRCASRPAAPCVMSVLRRIELPPLELAALSAALAARTEAPMVEAWAQHAAAAMGRDEGRGAVVAAACNETHASIRAAVAAATTGACAGDAAEVVDHALPSAGEGAGSPRLVAYVDPHSPGLAKAIERLLEAAAGRSAANRNAALCDYRIVPQLHRFSSDIIVNSVVRCEDA
ncbi:hypothetical protein EMIHUDRAFT_120421, partial [Emiliania huxleyi CCMP1516]|uniref:Saposin B-type domain-containing protein n=2 Tax=Emiliania huxleyi TaxID=2903 RepID=A0A0D3IIG7_EMIH1